MRVPFGDLSEQYKAIKPAIDRAVRRVLQSGWYILGREVGAFEKRFARYVGVRRCVGTANGLEALQIALLACDVKRGDEVITTPVSAAATALAIIHVGAVPVFADVDPKTLLLDPQKIEQAITKKTKALIPVHLYGQMCDMRAIMSIAKKHGLKVVEDCAQAAGAAVGKRKAGSFGDFGAFSFYPTKNLGAYGDGGCLVTRDSGLAKIAKALSDYGQIGKYDHFYTGLNSRLDEIQAAVLSVKLNNLKNWNNRRRQIAGTYSKLLSGLPLEVPRVPNDDSHIFHQYVIKTKSRDKLRDYLAQRGISTQIHYPKTLYQQHAIKKFARGRCPQVEKAVGQIISLPIYPELTDAEVKYVCRQIRDFYKNPR